MRSLLRVYPAAWRARYGHELAALLEQIEGGGRLSWRARLDVLRAGLVERASGFAQAGLPPCDRARAGSLLVLYAWVLFVLGGLGVQKVSEHWQAVTPSGEQALPAAAFGVLVVAAAVGSVLVLLGVALSLPHLAALIGAGGFAEIRRPLVRAASLGVLTTAATVGLVAWAHSLPAAAHNGGDAAYGGVFVAWLILVAGCLLVWAAAAAATARRLALPAATLRLEVWLAGCVTVTMAVMTVATAVWWGALASAAPGFFEGGPLGSRAGELAPTIAVPAGLMLVATALGLLGTTRAVRALAQSSPPPGTR